MSDNPWQESNRYVDMWVAPGLHPTNIEFLQRLKTADTQHFTREMDVVGTISEENADGRWEKSHLIGLRTDVWKPCAKEAAKSLDAVKKRRRAELKKEIKRSGRLNAKQSVRLDTRVEQDQIMQTACEDIERRRLVMKLFRITGTRTNWAGTIEQLTATEVHNSMGSRKNLLTMAAMLPRYDMVTTIQQNHVTFRVPATFSLGFYHDARMWQIVLRKRWVSFGPDFDIWADGQRIGLIDARLLAMGTDSYVTIHPHPLAECRPFVDLMTMFACTLGYHKAAWRSVRRRVKACMAGNWHHHIIEDEELRLRHNGRAAA